MLYRVETGLHAGLDDTQGRKTAQHLLKALNLSTGSVRQIKVFTAEGLSEAQVRRLLDEGIWHDPILQAASLEPLPAGHAFWNHPRITATPHTSARTLREESIAQIAGKIGALERGEAIAGIVDPGRGY